MNAKASILTKAVVAASLAGALVTAGAAPAAAQGIGSNIIGCSAPGGQQPVGALIGGVLGAAVGSNLSKNDRGGGTAVGALAGAAAGSWVGCKNQRDRQTRAYNGGYQPAPAAYNRSYDRSAAGAYVAGATVNVRSGPSTGAARVGSIGAGQTFNAVGRDGSWLVVSNGAGLGYVHGGYVRPAGYQQANYGYGY